MTQFWQLINKQILVMNALSKTKY